jgi:hypothetical protein
MADGDICTTPVGLPPAPVARKLKKHSLSRYGRIGFAYVPAGYKQDHRRVNGTMSLIDGFAYSAVYQAPGFPRRTLP